MPLIDDASREHACISHAQHSRHKYWAALIKWYKLLPRQQPAVNAGRQLVYWKSFLEAWCLYCWVNIFSFKVPSLGYHLASPAAKCVNSGNKSCFSRESEGYSSWQLWGFRFLFLDCPDIYLGPLLPRLLYKYKASQHQQGQGIPLSSFPSKYY